MNNLYNQKVIDANSLFDNRWVKNETLYLSLFNSLPNLSFMGALNGEKMYKAFKEQYQSMILREHKYRWYTKKDKKFNFDKTILVMTNDCLVEFNTSYCEILHNGMNDEFVNAIALLCTKFKEKTKKQPHEINLIMNSQDGMYLKSMEIKKDKLDLDLFYNDDFKQIDDIIQTRLTKKDDKGIVLLHGLPGTGKTSYLRYLIGKIKKRMLFLSPNVAGDLSKPEFMDLLIDNPNTVLVIEDAENVIMDRKFSNSSSVSNLLNISDGLLADFLNVQLICTFNSSLTMVDDALMRKGRLIAKYEFGKLDINKAQKLSDHLGFKKLINEPMTLAEISNPQEQKFETKNVQILGFRTQSMLATN